MTGTGFEIIGMRIDGYTIGLFFLLLCAVVYVLIRSMKRKKVNVDKQAGDEGDD